jgi:plasmid stability protein
MLPGGSRVPVTLTIKQVPERLAQKLRTRAAANHRSLQGELMVILLQTISDPPAATEPEPPPYQVKRQPKKAPAHGRRMTLSELWERSQRLGPPSRSESAAIVREARDERHRRR